MLGAFVFCTEAPKISPAFEAKIVKAEQMALQRLREGASPIYSKVEDRTRLLIKKHSKFMNEALGSLEKGDIEDAKHSYDLAVSFGLSDIPECKELEDKFKAKLSTLKGKP